MNEIKQNNPKASWWQPSLLVFTRLSAWIAGPVILGVFLGKWLDRKYGTEPWLFLLTVGIAFMISMFGMVKDTVKEINRIEKESKKRISQSQNKEKL